MYKIIGADDKEYGPISVDQIRQWIAEGRVNANTKVMAEGTGVWKRVGELPEFTAATSAIVPPVHGAPISMTPPVGPAKGNLTAIWALVLGIIAFIPCCWGLMGIPAIVVGAVALSQIKRNPRQTGTGFAITGLVLGIISLLLGITFTILLLKFPQLMNNMQNIITQQQQQQP